MQVKDFAEPPGGLVWKRPAGRRNLLWDTHYSFGNVYKRITRLKTGKTTYYVLKDQGPAPSSVEKVDAEDPKREDVRYRVFVQCWYIDIDERWYLCTVVARRKNRMTIRPVTGWDAERVKQWPHDHLLEFPARSTNRMYQRLRPLRARVP